MDVYTSQLKHRHYDLVISIRRVATDIETGAIQHRLDTKLKKLCDWVIPVIFDDVPAIDNLLTLIHYGTKWRLGRRILIQCDTGVIKSPAAVMIMMMHRYKGLTEADALRVVKSMQPHAKPDKGILTQYSTLKHCVMAHVGCAEGYKCKVCT
jgi:predicted protein tyrosine phosphatase